MQAAFVVPDVLSLRSSQQQRDAKCKQLGKAKWRRACKVLVHLIRCKTIVL